MTRDEALASAVFGVSGTRLNDDECMRVFRDLRLAGFAIVPLEPTPSMIHAGTHAQAISLDSWGEPVGVYRAMIAAYEKEQGDD